MYLLDVLLIFAGLQEIFGNSDLLSLILQGKANEAKFLLTHGNLSEDDLNVANTNGKCLTPLLASLTGETISIVMEQVAIILIKNGADLNRKTSDTLETALHLAVTHRLPRVVHALLHGKIDLRARNSHGYTPLHSCVDTSLYVPPPESIEILHLLLNAGSEVNEDAISKKMSPLHVAVFNNNYIMANALLAKGADPNSVYINDPPVYVLKTSLTPLEMLFLFVRNNSYHRNCAVALLNYGADVSRGQADTIMYVYWKSSQALVGGTYECFDDYVLGITEKICRKKDMMEMDVRDAVEIYEKSVSFALYRLLKALYVPAKHGERSSHLEKMKFQYLDRILNRIVKGTYLETLPQEMVSDVIYLAGYYGWKLERLSWNVALVSHKMKINENAAEELAYALFLDGEKGKDKRKKRAYRPGTCRRVKVKGNWSYY